MTIFDRPSSSELLKAVIDFIDAETKSDDYPANKRFKLQIVSNVLNIVKREIDLGKKIETALQFNKTQRKIINNNAIKILKEKFSLDKMCTDTLNLYKNCIDKYN